MLGFGALGQSALGQYPDDATAYALAVDVGAFTFSGVAAGLTAARYLAADAGTFTLTGNDANVVVTIRRATFETGAFTLTGNVAGLAATRTLTASNLPDGESTQFGFAALGDVALGQSASDAVLTFGVSGQDARLARARAIVAEVGTFTLGGQSADLIRFLGVRGDAGAFTVTGPDVGLYATRTLTASCGTFAESGQVIEFVRRRKGLHIRPSGGSGLRASSGGGAKGLRVRA